MNFGGPTPEDEALRIIADARDHGVTFIDTANNYAGGQSEIVVGKALKGNRDNWFLATKVGNPLGAGFNRRGLSRLHVTASLETSLKRLQTDVIDLLYVHKVDALTPWEEVVETFGSLVRAGRIRYWGLSNVRGWQIAHVVHLARQMGLPGPVALQPYYNLLNRQPEVEVLPAAHALGLGIVPYSPVARGILSGKYQLNTTPEAGSRAARRDKRFVETEWRPESLELAQRISAHASERGAQLVDFAVAWVLANRAVTSVIAGPRTYEQWRSYLPALSYRWTGEDEALVDSLVVPGHSSTPGYTDPQYPVEGRFAGVSGR
jgi:aryl-alcohol dehydrogenase-like predicted oxidoreductase